MAKELLKRSEVDPKDTWNLADMYATTDDWKKDVEKIKKLCEEIAQYEGSVVSSGENLLNVMELSAERDQLLEYAYSYCEKLFDEDQNNSDHQAMAAKMQSLYSHAASKTAFVDPEILAADDSVLEEYFNSIPGLSLYKRAIEEIKRMKEHSLTAEMEKLLAMSYEMSQTPYDVFSMLNNADITFPEITDENGEKVRLTHGNYIQFLLSPNRELRKETFLKFNSVYKQFLNTSASLYDGQLKQQIFYAKARKYNSALEAAVDANDVSPEIYKNLISTVNANLDKLHRYVVLRKRCLGLNELHMYDIYTPMIPDVAKKIPYEEAKSTVLKALAPLGEDYTAVVKEGFENRWIDVYENEGKRSGAYSAGTFGCHPYVLMNYNQTLDSMFTLAHEMGHAMHSHYSNTNQPYIYSQYKIFLAEVASTCNEILLMEYLLKNTNDKNERLYLLNHYLDDFKGTVFRQSQFAEFEMLSNEMAERGEAINKDSLNKLYFELNQKYYGSDIVTDPETAFEWSRIPHFYYNFYVYQYSTGFSSAVAIAKSILKEGASAVERYKGLLKGGCLKPPVELLKEAGVDLATPAPIQAALNVFSDTLDEFEKLYF